MDNAPLDETHAERLLGVKLSKGWVPVEKLVRPVYATGGCFSQGYVVDNQDGRRGYLKALDYSMMLRADDPAVVLQAMTAAFVFERSICDLAVKRSMRRVVKAIDSGTVVVGAGAAAGSVQYLIFELADGDVRKHLAAVEMFDAAAALRALHHAATGLFELHGSGVAHQDLKPSNLLVFPGLNWKVGDLGRATLDGHVAPHDGEPVAGDRAYAPPELLYHQSDGDWNRRRFGCDAYLLGSMVLFLFANAGMTSQILDQLDPSFHWSQWRGTYDEVLPYLRDAYGRALQLTEKAIAPSYRAEIMELIRQLCDPDPKLRGHPELRGRSGNQYSLERYISRFDLLAKRAELDLKRGL